MSQTLAKVLGETTHISPLLNKIQHITGETDMASCLKQLAVNRGCLHYDGAFKPPTIFPQALNLLSNEEAGIALCTGSLPYDPNNIRIAAELLSAGTCKPEKIIELCLQEHCQTVVGYIAKCGKQVEPENPVWNQIHTGLAPIREAPSGTLPHWTRFVSMTGVTPNNGGPSTVWLRPNPKYEQSRTNSR